MRSEDGTRKLRTYGEAKRKRTRPDPPNPSETNNNLKNGRYGNDIERHRKGIVESIVRNGNGGIALCVGGLAVGIAAEILLGMLSFMFGILITTASLAGLIALMVWLLTI